MDDEAAFLAKMKELEAMFVGATAQLERATASLARDRIRRTLREQAVRDGEIEYRFTLSNTWSMKLFIALVRRYGMRPYRHPGQRRTTLMVKGPKRFLDETLWPHFVELDRELRKHLDEAADRMITTAMETGTMEADTRADAQLSLPSEPTGDE